MVQDAQKVWQILETLDLSLTGGKVVHEGLAWLGDVCLQADIQQDDLAQIQPLLSLSFPDLPRRMRRAKKLTGARRRTLPDEQSCTERRS